MQSRSRPVYLNPLRLHLPLPGWVSLLHRLSGALLFLMLPLAVWGFSFSLSSERNFLRTAAWLSNTWFKPWLVLAAYAFAQHFFAGVRHLLMDAHCGVRLPAARRSGIAVLLATGAVTAWAAWGLYA